MASPLTPASSTVVLDGVVSKVIRRLVPFLLLMYVLAFLDRANVGFAKEAFQADTGLSNAAYATGAGIFFIGYAVFEVPSNMIMHRVGARIWMCRIMITWGLVSAATVFAHTATVFYGLRFLLGVAEAGFFPGVILYLTYWIPASHRGKVMGLFYFGAPLAFIFGGPLSGGLLELKGNAGLQGWQWLFLVEGLLATSVGVWAWFYLENRPQESTRLSAEDRDLLVSVLDEENKRKAEHSPSGILRALRDPKVLYLSLIYFTIQVSVYGVTFYLPTQIAHLVGKKVGFEVGLITAIPWTVALIASYVVGRRADRVNARHLLAAVTLGIGGLGIAFSVIFSSPVLALIALCFGAAGFIAVQPVFWTIPTGYLTGVAAASGIALINSLGSLGGFVAPNVKNWADSTFSSSSAGSLLLAATTLVGAVLLVGVAAMGLGRTRRTDAATTATASASGHR